MTEVIYGGVLKLVAKLLAYYIGAGEGGNIPEHLLPSVSEAGSLNRYAGEGAS